MSIEIDFEEQVVIIHWSCTWVGCWHYNNKEVKMSFVNRCEFQRMVLTTVKSSNLCQNGTSLSMCSKIMLKNKDTCWIKWTTFNFMRMSHSVLMN